MILENTFIIYGIAIVFLISMAMVFHVIDRLKHKNSGWLDIVGIVILVVEYRYQSLFNNYANILTPILITIIEVVFFTGFYQLIGIFAINQKKQQTAFADACSTFLYFKIVFSTIGMLMSKMLMIFQMNTAEYIESVKQLFDILEIQFVDMYAYLNNTVIPSLMMNTEDVFAIVVSSFVLCILMQWLCWNIDCNNKNIETCSNLMLSILLLYGLNEYNFSIVYSTNKLYITCISGMVGWIILWKTFISNQNHRLTLRK